MAVVIGLKQQIKTYQIMQENNNYANINSKFSSNLIYLNTDINTYSNASIVFRNNYEFGYINDKISIYNNHNNLFTVDTNTIDLYKNTYFHSNINVDNYFYTNNNTTYFNNNFKLNLNDNINNSFEINYNNISPPVLRVFKDNVYFNSSNIYTSNIYVDPNSTIYTNFIDSPNLKPVIIKNMAFAESLRLLSANVIQNIAIDNNIIFANLTDYKPGTPNISTYAPSNSLLWSQYMKNNNINQIDPFFIRPNISIIKYVDKDANAVIGGSNIVEFKTSKLATSNIASLVHSVNNFGYISIGSNYNHDIPLKIRLSPISSNIFEYTNLNDINNKCCSINSNGFISIGIVKPVTTNQLTITKNSNLDNNNSDLISLNINTASFATTTGNITIPFINNNNYTNFIFDISILSSTVLIIITNNFIKDNIIKNNLTLYESSQYSSLTFNDINDIIIKFPINIFNISKKTSLIEDTYIFVIYPIYIISEPNYNSINFNKITLKTQVIAKNITIELYVYKETYNYIYNGIYYPKYTNFISCSNNNKTSLSLSSAGNLGIGTNYLDTYNLYTSNALIDNITCKSIDNFPLKSISLCNCSVDNINAINNASHISTNNLICLSNISSNILNNDCIINNNLTVLGVNDGTIKLNAKTIYNGENQFENYIISIYGSNAIAITNNIINKNPNIIINSTCSNSYPYLMLKNTSNLYNIAINNNNNFQITNKDNISIIQNNYLDNNINILDTSLCIFKDVNSNVKIFMGANTSRIETYYSYISSIGKNPANRSSINTYGNINFCDSAENPIINSYYDVNNRLRIGIGTVNNDIDSNGMVVNLSTLFSSNITAKRNILLEGTILSISDSNLKTDIKKINEPLAKINEISGYTYMRKDTSNMETGLLAQEVINILPEVVKFENNHYNISYGNMCGLFVECIKELNNKIKILEDKIANL